MEISLATPVKFDKLLTIYAKSEAGGNLRIRLFSEVGHSGDIEQPISTSWEEYTFAPNELQFTAPKAVSTIQILGNAQMKTLWIDGLSIK